MPLAGRLRAEQWIVWFRDLGALLAARFTASVRTPVEGKIETYTAAWTRVIQGYSQDRRQGKRKRSGHAGLDIDCGASVQPGGTVGEVAVN